MKWKDHVLGFKNMNKPWLSKFDRLSELKKRKQNIDINVYPKFIAKYIPETYGNLKHEWN
jgi:hypothetical protein